MHRRIFWLFSCLALFGCGQTPASALRPDANLQDVSVADSTSGDAAPDVRLEDAVAMDVPLDSQSDAVRADVRAQDAVGSDSSDAATDAGFTNRCFGRLRSNCPLPGPRCSPELVPEIVDGCQTGSCIDPVTECTCQTDVQCGAIDRFSCTRTMQCVRCGNPPLAPCSG